MSDDKNGKGKANNLLSDEVDKVFDHRLPEGVSLPQLQSIGQYGELIYKAIKKGNFADTDNIT
ncbi:MAG: hypothetical protein AAGF07_03680 [Patescibacteria group bacterium]